ncbi:MAG: oligosaccharide flippase family protein [Clostridia bacterium]|nr:oligosaccharide flippase family protein [Clostridia bacterium]
MFSVLTRCLGFLYKIYLSRVMSTMELGVYNLTLSIYMVVITLVGSSIPLTISKIATTNKTKNKEFNTNYSVTSSLILSIGLALITCFCILILKTPLIAIIGNNLGFQIIISLIPSIIFTAIYSQIRGYLWGYENYFAVSMVEFIEQILRIIFCMIFVTLNIFSSPVIAVGTALSIACGISTLYGIILYLKNGGKFKFKKGYFKEIIRSSAPLTGVRLFGSLINPTVSVLLPILLTSYGISKEIALSELGIITGMSMPLLSIPSTIIGALCMVLVPRINSSINNNENLNTQISNYIQFSIICLFIFLPIFIILGVPICSYVFENLSAGLYLSFSAWIIIPMGISQITSSILNALNQEQKSFIYYIISSLFMLIAIFILPQFVGIKAMTYSIGISSIVLSLLNIKKIKKLTGFSPKIINLLIVHLLLNLPIILITKLTYNCLNIIMTPFFAIAFSCVVCVLGYIALLFCFNILNFKSMQLFVSNFIKNKKVMVAKTKNGAK